MASNDYVLYHHISSICSIMVRYCFAERGPPQAEEINIREQSVDIFHYEQLEEWYLCDVNPFGEVPALAHDPLKPDEESIPDSLRITFYLAQFYPCMIPASQRDEISASLKELHAINYFSLTFTDKPETARGIQEACRKHLDSQIAERYRKALEYKLAHMEDCRVHALQPDAVEQARQQSITLLKKLEPHLKSSQSGWLYGVDIPSALDAHLVVFLARMRDVGRYDLIPEAFEEYADRAFKRDAWKSVQSGSTKPPSA